MTPGLSETLEVQEKYAHLQEEQLDNLKDDLVSCIHGEEGQGNVVCSWAGGSKGKLNTLEYLGGDATRRHVKTLQPINNR